MKPPRFSKFMMLMMAMLLAASAFAAGALHKGSLQVVDPILVNGKEIAPGNYTVVWEGEGPDTSMHIMQGKKEVATAPAKVVPLDQKASQDAAEVNTSSAGRELSAVRFSGQKYQLDLTGGAGEAQMRSGNSVK